VSQEERTIYPNQQFSAVVIPPTGSAAQASL